MRSRTVLFYVDNAPNCRRSHLCWRPLRQIIPILAASMWIDSFSLCINEAFYFDIYLDSLYHDEEPESVIYLYEILPNSFNRHEKRNGKQVLHIFLHNCAWLRVPLYSVMLQYRAYIWVWNAMRSDPLAFPASPQGNLRALVHTVTCK